jgi:hypothetical protein
VCSVEHLARLTGWAGHGTAATDWTRAEEELGSALPPDYRELAERFPYGTFQGYLDFYPDADIFTDLRELRLSRLRRLRDNTPDEDEVRYRQYVEASEGRPLPDWEISCPFPLWPEPGGIYPWTEGGDDATFFWLRTGPDPSSWPVVWCHGEDILWERFDGPATEFLIALVNDEIDSRRLGSPIFPQPPRFDAWVAGGFVPRPNPGSMRS